MLNRRWQFRLGYLFVFLLTVISALCSSVSPASAQARFSDIQGHWARPCIEALTDRKIINGYPDRTFRPNSPVTRAEYAALLVTAFPGLVNATLPARDLKFQDIPNGFWAAGAIELAVNANFFSGYPDKTFRPNQNIPRVQALVALARDSALKNPVSQTLALFSDAQSIPDYAKNAIARLTEQRSVVNYPNVKQLNPNQPATRGDIAAFLCRALPGAAALVPDQYVAGKPEAQLSEIRGVWLTNIDSDVMFSRDRLTKTVSELADANVNTVYPAVWNWGYTLYPSETAKKTIGVAYDPRPEAVGLNDRDMLKEFIEQGHQRKLSVIPWFEFGFMAPADSELARLHPDWLTQRSDKTQVWQEGKYPRVWLNPFKPEVQTFIS
ncbi:MAG: family 10 glycosylhydrolase, partial [Phormidesmis sp. CAN_BIN36]|nr:family 10 glycosylhydrolase [Phormidesmis sp. CAN_BIN36]